MTKSQEKRIAKLKRNAACFFSHDSVIPSIEIQEVGDSGDILFHVSNTNIRWYEQFVCFSGWITKRGRVVVGASMKRDSKEWERSKYMLHGINFTVAG